MAAINQRIPNFLGGVSQQPDTIKFPGQLRVCDNAVPDITFGLMKRPPGELIGTLANANSTGQWFEILRDNNEKYLVQITPANTGSMPIRIWDLADGSEKSLTNSSGDSLFAYLSGATDQYTIQTIQDYTLIANPQKTVGTTGNTAAPLNSGQYAFARLDTVAYNTEYVLYSGATAPTPKTYYRATSLSVSKAGTAGNTWDHSDPNGQYAGLGQFDFAGGDNITVPGGQVEVEDLIGHVTVNQNSFIVSQDANYDGTGSAAEDFLGYTQNYDSRYTANITLKSGGIIKTETKNTALAVYIDLSIEGQSYRINVDTVEPVTTYEDVSGIAWYKSPKNPDKGTLSMAAILKGLHDSVNSNLTNVTSETIGNGLYLYGSAAPACNFLGGAINEGMTIMSRTATDVSEIPPKCKHGYVVQVSNTENSDSDDYYLKFIADDGVQGSGKWEETVRPHNFTGSDAVVLGLDPATMPHALINNRNGTFTFKELDSASAPTKPAQGWDNYWKNREVGDDETNPHPSFNGLNIQEIFFHRNRLGFIADEQVVMSRPGDYFNFYVVSALTTSDDNPVDITVSDLNPAFIHHVVPNNKGALLFSDNGQFLLFTESDIMSPKTARIKKIASYECDSTIKPLDLGTTTLFTTTVAAYTRAFEATILDDTVPPNVLEQTRVVPEFIPNDITLSKGSTGLGLATYGKKGSSEIYHYKYFNSGEKRDQSAWYSWTLTGTMQHFLYTGGNFYTVTLQGSNYVLNRYEYTTNATSGRTYVLGGAAADVGSPLKTARWFEACLDNMTIPTAINYTAHGGSVTGPDFTDVTIPYTPNTATDFYAVALSGTDTNGNEVAGQVVAATSVGTNKATFVGVNMTGWVVAVGYKYTTTVELPNYYATGEKGGDVDADLRISGLNFEMGVGGPMEFHLSSTYADMASYVQYESGLKLDDSDFGKPPARLSKSVRVPIQKKNEKYNLTIKYPDPFSTALISASWDGIYHTRRHVRR